MSCEKKRTVVITVVTVKEGIGNPNCPHKVGDKFTVEGPILRVTESNDFCLTAYDSIAAPIWSMKYLPKAYLTGPFKEPILGCPDHHRVMFKIEVFEGNKKLA